MELNGGSTRVGGRAGEGGQACVRGRAGVGDDTKVKVGGKSLLRSCLLSHARAYEVLNSIFH